MKIAVDHQSTLGRPTGIGMAARELVTAMRSLAPEIEFLLYTDNSKQDLNTWERMAWESIRIPAKARRDKAQILYSPGFAPAYASKIPRIVTVHDLIGRVFKGNQGFVSSFYWSQWLPTCVKRAQNIVASSEWTKNDIVRLLGVSEKQIEVVPLGVSGHFRPLTDRSSIARIIQKYGIREPYFVMVGTQEPRKNHLKLLEAYRMLRLRHKNAFSLVLAGKQGASSAAIDQFIKEEGLSEHIHPIGYIPDEELVWLYNGALGYVMISFYEGFGLPVLEAMSCGKTGVCSNRTSLPEVAGNTALMVDPDNADQIADDLQRLAEQNALRERLAQAAYDRSKQFSNEKAAKQMIAIFKNAA